MRSDLDQSEVIGANRLLEPENHEIAFDTAESILLRRLLQAIEIPYFVLQQRMRSIDVAWDRWNSVKVGNSEDGSGKMTNHQLARSLQHS